MRAGQTMSTRHYRCGDTYPEQVKFVKGHGTENDFVLLPDLEAGLARQPPRGSARCAIGVAAWVPTACCG